MTRAHREGGKAKRKRAELSFPPKGANLAGTRPAMAQGAAGAEGREQPRSPGLAPRPHNAPVEGPAEHGRLLPPARPRSARPRSLTMVRRLAGSRPSPARPPPSRPPRSGEAGPHRAFPQCPERHSRRLLPPAGSALGHGRARGRRGRAPLPACPGAARPAPPSPHLLPWTCVSRSKGAFLTSAFPTLIKRSSCHPLARATPLSTIHALKTRVDRQA